MSSFPFLWWSLIVVCMLRMQKGGGGGGAFCACVAICLHLGGWGQKGKKGGKLLHAMV